MLVSVGWWLLGGLLGAFFQVVRSVERIFGFPGRVAKWLDARGGIGILIQVRSAERIFRRWALWTHHTHTFTVGGLMSAWGFIRYGKSWFLFCDAASMCTQLPCPILLAFRSMERRFVQRRSVETPHAAAVLVGTEVQWISGFLVRVAKWLDARGGIGIFMQVRSAERIFRRWAQWTHHTRTFVVGGLMSAWGFIRYGKSWFVFCDAASMYTQLPCPILLAFRSMERRFVEPRSGDTPHAATVLVGTELQSWRQLFSSGFAPRSVFSMKLLYMRFLVFTRLSPRNHLSTEDFCNARFLVTSSIIYYLILSPLSSLFLLLVLSKTGPHMRFLD